MKTKTNCLKEDILLSYHKQFAENQRVKEQYFLRIAGYLGAIVFGYAYVYQKSDDQFQDLSFVLLASLLFLALGSAVIVNIAYSWRRDQTVNSKIRKICDLLGDDKVFPSSYDPRISLQEKCYFSWMPDLLIIFYLSFPITQLFVLITYCLRVNIRLSTNWSAVSLFITVTMILSTLFIVVTLVLPIIYFDKINNFLAKNQDSPEGEDMESETQLSDTSSNVQGIIPKYVLKELSPLIAELQSLAEDVSQLKTGFIESFCRSHLRKCEKQYSIAMSKFMNAYAKWYSPDRMFKDENDAKSATNRVSEHIKAKPVLSEHIQEGFRLLSFIDRKLNSNRSASDTRVATILSLIAITIAVITAILK